LVEEELEFLFGVRVAGEDDLAAVGGGEVHVEHLHGPKFLERASRGEAGGALAEPGFEGDLQGAGKECDHDMGFEPVIEQVVDGAQGEVVFELFERLFDFGESNADGRREIGCR